MGSRNTCRILLSSAFLVLVMIGVEVMAQTAVHPSTTGTAQQTQPSKGVRITTPSRVTRLVRE